MNVYRRKLTGQKDKKEIKSFLEDCEKEMNAKGDKAIKLNDIKQQGYKILNTLFKMEDKKAEIKK